MLGLNLKNREILKVKTTLVKISAGVIIATCVSACGGKSGSTATAAKDDDTAVTTKIDDCKKKDDLTARQYCLNSEYRKRIDECYEKDTSKKRNDCINDVVDKFGLNTSNYDGYYNFSTYSRAVDPFYLSVDKINAVYGNSYFAVDPWTYYLDTSDDYIDYGYYY